MPLYADAEYINPQDTPEHLFEQPIQINGKYNYIEYQPGHPELGFIPQYLDQEQQIYDLNINVGNTGGGLDVKKIIIKNVGLDFVQDVDITLTNNNWNFYNTFTGITLNGYEEILKIYKSNSTNNYQIEYLRDFYGEFGNTIYVFENTWVYVNNINDEQNNESTYNCEFRGSNNEVLFSFNDDNGYDDTFYSIRFNINILNFDISWMTFN